MGEQEYLAPYLPTLESNLNLHRSETVRNLGCTYELPFFNNVIPKNKIKRKTRKRGTHDECIIDTIKCVAKLMRNH